VKTLKGKFRICEPPSGFEDLPTNYTSYEKNSTRDYYTFERAQLREKVIASGAYTLEEIERIEAEGCRIVAGNCLSVSPFSGLRYFLSLRFAENILKGLKILMGAVASDSAEMLVPSNYPGLARSFGQWVRRSPNVSLREAGDYYPLGFTEIVHKRLYGMSCADHYFPGIGGVLIVPLEKLLNIYLYVEEPRNSGLRPLAVITGNEKYFAWAEPQTTISSVLKLAGINNVRGFIIKGDPLWGRVVRDPRAETLGDISQIFILPSKHIRLDECVRCSRCVDVCPARLRYPHSMVCLDQGKEVPFADIKGCLGCGLCAFLCPGWKK
jgi:electron transport complex protein RnfC